MTKKTKLWLWIAACLTFTGILIFAGVMTMLKWDFTKLSTTAYQTKEYTFSESFTGISIETNTANIVFAHATDGKAKVVCYEDRQITHNVAVQEGTLRVKVTDTRKWYHHIGISFGAPKITVYLPSDTYETVSLKLSTGDVHIPRLTCLGDVSVQVSTGDVNISQLTCQGDISIKVSTGQVKMTDVTCQNFHTTGSTGDISLKNVVATEKWDIRRSTGHIRFDSCDSGEILIKTDTGDIRGSLLSEKIFTTQTDTGNIRVPKSTSGGLCEITTDTGDILIQYAK